MSARTRNVLYIVFIVISLTIILGLSISYVAIARSASVPAYPDQSVDDEEEKEDLTGMNGINGIRGSSFVG